MKFEARVDMENLRAVLDDMTRIRGDLWGIVTGSGQASDSVRRACRDAMHRADAARTRLNPAYYEAAAAERYCKRSRCGMSE